MNKTVKIILWVLLGFVAIVGILVALNVATFTSFTTKTSTQVEISNTTEYGPTSRKKIIPEECQSFSDGCNTCNRMDNGEVACTRMYCERYEKPECLDTKDIENEVKNTENVETCDALDPLSQCALGEDDFDTESGGISIHEERIPLLSRNEAIEKVKEEGLVRIFQKHNLDISFITKNGKEYKTQEPKIDSFDELIAACNPACPDVPIATE